MILSEWKPVSPLLEKKISFVAQKCSEVHYEILHQCHNGILLLKMSVCVCTDMGVFFEAGTRWIEPAFGARFK